MESKAVALASAIRSGHTSVTPTLNRLGELKTEIKHRQVPDGAILPLFRLVGDSVTRFDYVEAGLSMLGHLTKRLVLQDQKEPLVAQAIRILPSLVVCFGDRRDRIRQRAAQALCDMWRVCPTDVEQVIRDVALTCDSPVIKEAGLRWILKAKKDHDMQFKVFVPRIIECLLDVNGVVRESAKIVIITLFQSITNERAKQDLQKGLQQRGVDQSTIVSILAQLGVAISADAEPATSSSLHATSTIKPQATSTTKPHTTSHSNKKESSPKIDTNNDPPPFTTTTVAEREADQLEPAYIETARDLEDVFQDMQPHFEGKETDQNWSLREKSIIKLRKITKGNALEDFTTTYLSGIKTLLDGILKTVNSLRTTVCTNGCHLIQDIARVAGFGIDNLVEILLQNLIKLCANTKKISASNANITADTIFANASYNIRLLQHIWNAFQDKNVQPRTFATGWLKTIITKHGQRKSILEHAGGLDLMEKCIKAGLTDRDQKVRESMRPTYWAFARIYPEKSEHIIGSLVKKQQELLIEDPSNPNPQKPVSSDTPGRAHAFSKSTTSVPATRPSIRDTIAAQKKRANFAGSRLPDRPGSADSAVHSPNIKPSSGPSRPATAIGSLSSAPVRPFRLAKRPESTKQPAINHPPAELPAKVPLAELPAMGPVLELPATGPVPELPAAAPLAKPSMAETSAATSTAVEIPAETLKVYEDPSPETEKPCSPQPLVPSKVLEELPTINKKLISLEPAAKSANTSGKTVSVASARRLLESGIVRVRARTLDIHGFRKLQGLIRDHDDIWGDGAKFNELLFPLLECLEEPSDESTKVLDLKTQVLATVRLMQKHQPKLFAASYPRVLCSLLTARKHIQKTSHLVYTFDQVANLIVTSCEPEACMDAVLDLLEIESKEVQEFSSLFMGMSVLEGLLQRYATPANIFHLTSGQENRLGSLTARCLTATSPDIRRAVISCALGLNDCIADEPRFWELIGSARDDHRDLITYYIAKRAESKARDSR